MSRARIEKLEALLARGERRRAEPRLVPVGVPEAASNTNVSVPNLNVATVHSSAASATPSLAERANTIPSPRPKAPPVSFEVPSPSFRAQGDEPRVSTSLRSQADESRASTSHLSLDHPSRRASSLPPPPVATADTLPKVPATPPPPADGGESAVRAPTEVLPAAPERIAPQPTRYAEGSAESAVQVVSAPRIDAPRSFGDLLALSLSLRPR